MNEPKITDVNHLKDVPALTEGSYAIVGDAVLALYGLKPQNNPLVRIVVNQTEWDRMIKFYPEHKSDLPKENFTFNKVYISRQDEKNQIFLTNTEKHGNFYFASLQNVLQYRKNNGKEDAIEFAIAAGITLL
jgi:hypothetical protein